MTPYKSDARRKEKETLLEFDLIEPSKSPRACEKVVTKKGTSSDFVAIFDIWAPSR